MFIVYCLLLYSLYNFNLLLYLIIIKIKHFLIWRIVIIYFSFYLNKINNFKRIYFTMNIIKFLLNYQA